MKLRCARLSKPFAKWLLALSVQSVGGLAACSSDSDGGSASTGGDSSTGGAPAGTTGGKAGTVSGGSGGSVGSGAVGGAAPSGGSSGATAGAAATGGVGAGGTRATGGSGNTGGSPPGTGGSSGGQQGGTGGAGPTGGSSAGAGASPTAGAAGAAGGEDTRPWFSFFVTSLDGLLSLAPDKTNGFGGDLGGLEGADEICRQLAQRGNPGDKKTWRAFLSTAGYEGGTKVDAIDRVGPGPWYDLAGRLLASDVAGLDPESNDGRPDGASQLVEMFTTELGEPMRADQSIDNHDTLTGSNKRGRLHEDGEEATCHDWTSNTLHAEIPVGHGWPRSRNNGRNWIQDHTVNGCEPGVFIGIGGGAPRDNFTVGGGGGYGAFYCFALGATAPPP